MTGDFPFKKFIFCPRPVADIVNNRISLRLFIVKIRNQPDVSQAFAVQIPGDDIAGFVIFRFPGYR
jgi:hypothetical protein